MSTIEACKQAIDLIHKENVRNKCKSSFFLFDAEKILQAAIDEEEKFCDCPVRGLTVFHKESCINY